MGYRILADATMVAHFAFLVYVVLGGFLAWRWPRLLWPHLVAALWGGLILAELVVCPLTYLESWARVRGGEKPLPSSGFIDYYIEGRIYPEAYTPLVQMLVIGCVLASWAVPLRRRRRRTRTNVRASESTGRLRPRRSMRESQDGTPRPSWPGSPGPRCSARPSGHAEDAR